jgi:hypothetical protein
MRRTYTAFLGVLACSALVVGLGSAPATAKNKNKDDKVFIQTNCKKNLKETPRHIDLNCRRGHRRHKGQNIKLKRLHWQHNWGNNRARGKGKISIPDSPPNPRNVKVRVKRVHTCHKGGNKGDDIYRRIYVTFRGAPPPGWSKRVTERLDCNK